MVNAGRLARIADAHRHVILDQFESGPDFADRLNPGNWYYTVASMVFCADSPVRSAGMDPKPRGRCSVVTCVLIWQKSRHLGTAVVDGPRLRRHPRDCGPARARACTPGSAESPTHARDTARALARAHRAGHTGRRAESLSGRRGGATDVPVRVHVRDDGCAHTAFVRVEPPPRACACPRRITTTDGAARRR